MASAVLHPGKYLLLASHAPDKIPGRLLAATHNGNSVSSYESDMFNQHANTAKDSATSTAVLAPIRRFAGCIATIQWSIIAWVFRLESTRPSKTCSTSICSPENNQILMCGKTPACAKESGMKTCQCLGRHSDPSETRELVEPALKQQLRASESASTSHSCAWQAI